MNKYFRYFATLMFHFCLLGLSPNELNELAQKLFTRECQNRHEYLAYWNPKEEFPSFGIGHFIWLPHGVNAPFEEQFPNLLKYMHNEGISFPEWLDPYKACPWSSKQAFDADIERTQELRQFLWQTRIQQAAFISMRFNHVIQEIVSCDPSLKSRIDSLKSSAHGLYAMLDYCHFKGSGTNPLESYDNTRWGLMQVLQEMDPANNDAILAFVESGKKVLSKRVRMAPKEKNEQIFLQGWINRLNSYLP